MKKLMALCLAMLMALSMVSFSVMAEETEAPALAATFEDIANGQPAAFVTSNLVLGEHTITSSNEAVIATDGTVTRPLYEDATVTLTINGGEAVEVTVKAKTANVLYSTDFSVDSTPASKAFPGYTGWFFGNDVTNSTAISGGKLYADHGVEGADKGYMYLYAPTMSSSVSTRPVTYSFSVSDIANISVGVDIRLSGSWYDENGTKLKDFSNVTISRCNSLSGFGSYGFTTGVSASKKISFKYDPTTGDSWLNGKKCEYYNSGAGETYHLLGLLSWNQNKNTGVVTEVRAPEGAASVKITNFLFVDAGSTSKGSYKLDDFVVYEDVSAEDALASATPAEKVANYSGYLAKDYVANGNDLNGLAGNLRFTADEALPADVTLTWTSSNPAIAADGAVKRPFLSAEKAVITGTLACGDVSVSKSYNVTILPLTLAGQSEIVDFDSYGLADGAAITNTGWSNNAQLAVANTVDGANSYATISNDGSLYATNAASYTFQDAPQANGRYYVMEYDWKVNSNTAGSALGFALNVNGSEVAKFVTRGNTKNTHPYIWKSGDSWYGSSTGLVYINSTNFVRLKMVIDTQENTISYYANDVLKYSEPRYGSADLSNISSVKLQISWRNIVGSVSIDNLQVYSENTLEGVLGTLPDSDKVGFFKELIEKSNIGTATSVGSALDLDNGYADYDPSAYGVAINWASADTTYIANDGTVKKLSAHGATLNVNMTATITAGSASATVVIPVAVANETTLAKLIDFSAADVSAGTNGQIVADEDAAHGNVVYMQNTAAGTHKSTAPAAVSGGGRKDRFVFSYDVKYIGGRTESYGGIILKTYAGRNGIGVYLNYKTNKIQLITTNAVVNGAATGADVKIGNGVYYEMPASIASKGEGEWVNVMIDYNTLSQSYYAYVDGILINEFPLVIADMDLGSNGGSAIRGYSVELSNPGEIWVDNVALYNYTDSVAEEVDAALNAALVDYASPINKPVLANCALPAMTIGASWVKGESDGYNRDLNGTAVKPTNVATYTYVTDGPAITWTVDGKPATAINVASPKEVTITVTATKNGISASKTFTKTVAPISIRGLALGTAECLNGAWIEGAKGDEKLIVAKYREGKLVGSSIADFADTATWNPLTGKGDRFNETLGMVHDLGTSNPKESPDYDQVKIFVVAADSITPLALTAELTE